MKTITWDEFEEIQDNDEEIYMTEVEPYEVTVTKYRAKK